MVNSFYIDDKKFECNSNPSAWTITTTDWVPGISSKSCDAIGYFEPIKYFNCKRCGAVGQHGVCKYCGSAE